VWNNDVEMVKLFVEGGANDWVDTQGRNAFMLACVIVSADVVAYLHAAGSWMHHAAISGRTLCTLRRTPVTRR
jgi:hypothetical protein